MKFPENKYVPREHHTTPINSGVSGVEEIARVFAPPAGPIPGGALNGNVKGGSNAPLNVPPLVEQR